VVAGNVEDCDGGAATFLMYLLRDANVDSPDMAIKGMYEISQLPALMKASNYNIKTCNQTVTRICAQRVAVGKPFETCDLVAMLKSMYDAAPNPNLVSYSQGKYNDYADGTKALDPKEYMRLMETKALEEGWNPISTEPVIDEVALQAEKEEERVAYQTQVDAQALKIASLEQSLASNTSQNRQGAGRNRNRGRVDPPWMKKPPTNGRLTMSKDGKDWKWCSHHAIWCSHTIENCNARAATEQTVVTANYASITQQQIDAELYGSN
jgi:hypothetical protein